MKMTAVAALLVLVGFVGVRYPPTPGCEGRKRVIQDPYTGVPVVQHNCTRSFIIRLT